MLSEHISKRAFRSTFKVKDIFSKDVETDQTLTGFSFDKSQLLFHSLNGS